MRILLDTQSFIWFVEDDTKLPEKIKSEIENSKNIIIISIASLWEMAIKISLGKLMMSYTLEKTINLIYENGFELLPVLPEHILELSNLPYFHRDPFDRILISQSLNENLHIVTSDDVFDKYEVKRKWK